MKRRTFLATSLGATVGLMGTGFLFGASKKEKVPDQTILNKAREQIAKHRVGKFTLHLADEQGRSLRHAKIEIEQLRHEFRFGANFFMFDRCPNPTLEEQYRAYFAQLFNYCTLGFYWGDYERERGKPHYDYTDKVVEYCVARKIECKGHPLVWDYKELVPSWLPNDLKEVEKLSKARVSEIVSRYKGRIDIWDVVNEATHLYEIKDKSRLDDLGIAMGQREFVAEHLKAAREANPGATLLVNDYKDNQKYFDLLDSLRENKKLLFDAVGLQSHQHRGAWPLEKVWNICELFAKLGLPLHFTETTFISGKRTEEGIWPTTPEGEAKQAEAVENFYTTLFGHPSVQALTWWDLSDLGSWQSTGGLLHDDMSPKPAYDRLLALMKRDWWTNTQGETGMLGKVSLRAFYGTHRVKITLHNGNKFTREINLQRGKENHFAFRL